MDLPLGVEQAETAAGSHNSRNERKGHCDRDQDPDRAGDAQGLEEGQTRKSQAEDRAGDRDTRGQDDFSHTAVGGVESRFAVLAGSTRLFISPEEEYPVICSSRDPDGHQKVHHEGSKPNDPMKPEERDDSPGHLQF